MRISIIVPSYNHGEFLGQTLESIIQQPVGDKEIIVIDNGSTDNSIDVIKSYERHLAYWVTRSNRGLADSYATGFHHATGDIMGWINSDDFYEPNAFEIVEDCFHRQPEVDILYGDMNWVRKDGTFLKKKKEINFDVDILLWDYCYIPQPSTFWRRRAWERISGIELSLQMAMDYDLWIKFVKSGARFSHVPVVLANMRFYPEQRNQRLRPLSNKEDQAIQAEFLGRRPTRVERNVRGYYHKARRVMKRIGMGAYW